MRAAWFICLFLALAFVLDVHEAAPEPKRRGGGSRRGSSSSSSSSGSGGWFSSGNKNSNSGYPKQNYGQNNYGGNNYGGSNYGGGKKKGGMGKTLKKAAVIGAVAYGSYQIGKMTNNFGHYRHGGQWGYNDYNRWREVDGFMCRTNDDCNWIDPRLYCQDYELDFSPSRAWFGGDFASIIGECACPRGSVFNNYELRCDRELFGTRMIMIIVGVIVVLILLCGCFFAARKFM